MAKSLYFKYKEMGYEIPQGYVVFALDWNPDNTSPENLCCVPARLANSLKKNETCTANPEYLRAIINNYATMRSVRKHYTKEVAQLPSLTVKRRIIINDVCKVIEMTNGEYYLYDDILDQVLNHQITLTNASATHFATQKSPWLIFPDDMLWDSITIACDKKHNYLHTVEKALIERYYPDFSTGICHYIPWRTKMQIYKYVTRHSVHANAKRIRSDAWTSEEDELIRNLYPVYGSQIAPLLKNRTVFAIRERARKLDIRCEYKSKSIPKLPDYLQP